MFKFVCALVIAVLVVAVPLTAHATNHGAVVVQEFTQQYTAPIEYATETIVVPVDGVSNARVVDRIVSPTYVQPVIEYSTAPAVFAFTGHKQQVRQVERVVVRQPQRQVEKVIIREQVQHRAPQAQILRLETECITGCNSGVQRQTIRSKSSSGGRFNILRR